MIPSVLRAFIIRPIPLNIRSNNAPINEIIPDGESPKMLSYVFGEGEIVWDFDIKEGGSSQRSHTTAFERIRSKIENLLSTFGLRLFALFDKICNLKPIAC